MRALWSNVPKVTAYSYVFGFALFVRNRGYTFKGLFSNKAPYDSMCCVWITILSDRLPQLVDTCFSK